MSNIKTVPAHYVIVSIANNTAIMETLSIRRKETISKLLNMVKLDWDSPNRIDRYRCAKVNIDLQEVR